MFGISAISRLGQPVGSWKMLLSDPEFLIDASMLALSLPVVVISIFLPREKRKALLKDLWRKWS